MSAIAIDPSASSWIARHGGDLTVRCTLQHGCCGGSARVPVAELGAPRDPSRYSISTVQGVRIHVERSLREVGLSVGLDGFGRWKRLVVEGPVLPPE
jgi:hypothetical protein